MDRITVADAFEIAISAEKAAEALFHGLEARFARRADVAAYWKQFAVEEAEHARRLESLQARLSKEQLSGSVDEQTVAMLQTIKNFSVDKGLMGVDNFDDAYQLVSDVENGETNAVFQFLFNNFEKDEQMREFLRSQLDDHINHLSTGLPAQYKSSQARKAIKAQH